MSQAPPKFFLTTPIYYVNARPHIGHAYTTIVADVLARRHRLQGDDTFFLTGTDEHGQKIERSAAAAGIPPQQFTDQVSAEFRHLWDRMGLTYDHFIRTTDPAHKLGAQKLFAELYARGAIYLSSYTGQYCVSEEIFVEGPPGVIGPDGKPTETVTEENFFFKLSEYQRPLLDLIESDTLAITPESRKNEVLSFLRGNVAEAQAAGGTIAASESGKPYVAGALRDLSVSRSSFTWGIPVPEPAASATEKKHVMYVWLDALANYMTAVGYGTETPEANAMFSKYWPADVHIMAKEITRQHCIYWPAFLLAAGLPTPRAVTAHGWLLFDDSKMSKSKGNIVRTETILDAFGTLCPPPAPPLSPSQTEGHPEQAALSQTEGHPELRGATSGPTEPKDPDSLSPTPTAGTIQPPLSVSTYPSTASASLKGTASAVPSSASAENAASAAEVPTPTPHDRDLFASDVLRYFLLREIPFGQDGSFSFEAMVTRYNADLANGYGNLVSRVLNLLHQNFAAVIPEPSAWARIASVEELHEFEGTQHELHGYTRSQILSDYLPQGLMDGLVNGIGEGFRTSDFMSVLKDLWTYIFHTDGSLSGHAPWKMIKDPAKRQDVADILYMVSEFIRLFTAQLYPILPYATANVWRQLGLGDIELAAKNGELTNLHWGGLEPGTKLGSLGPIFPRADKKLIETMTQMESEKNLLKQAEQTSTEPTSIEAPIASQPAAPPEAHHAAPPPVPADPWDPAAPPRTSSIPEENPGAQVGGSSAETTERPGTPSHTQAPASGIFAPQTTSNEQQTTPFISIDDFAKIELRVAKIIVAERIPKADKLLRLEVDLGTEKRQILSGIAEFYTPEELVGRRIVVITNLAPRKMRGLESHGMLLAASAGDHGKPILATFPDSDEIPLGSRLK